MKSLKQRMDESFKENEVLNESQTKSEYKATENESKISVDGVDYYLKKDRDTTHFDMLPEWVVKDSGAVHANKGLTQGIHVGQRRGEPYIKDIISWLKGGLSSKDLFGREYKGARML